MALSTADQQLAGIGLTGLGSSLALSAAGFVSLLRARQTKAYLDAQAASIRRTGLRAARQLEGAQRVAFAASGFGPSGNADDVIRADAAEADAEAVRESLRYRMAGDVALTEGLQSLSEGLSGGARLAGLTRRRLRALAAPAPRERPDLLPVTLPGLG